MGVALALRCAVLPSAPVISRAFSRWSATHRQIPSGSSAKGKLSMCLPPRCRRSGTGAPVVLRDPVLAEVLCHRVSAVQRLFSGNGLSIRGLLAPSCERARRSLGLLDLVVKA